MSGTKALVIDDEHAMRRLLARGLKSGGYELREAADGASGLAQAAAWKPDLVILDLGLPDMEGREVLARLREWSRAPVLVLTARDADADKVELLDAGADDYLTKPFSMPELLVRLRVLTRRLSPEGGALVHAGPLELDLAGHLARLQGRELRLTATEFEFLKALALHAGKVVTQRQILKEVWGPNAVEHTHYLRIYAAQLRKKIEEDPSDPKLLLTEPGVGYRLKA